MKSLLIMQSGIILYFLQYILVSFFFILKSHNLTENKVDSYIGTLVSYIIVFVSDIIVFALV